MSEPKILNIVTPSYYLGWPSLFNSPLLRDGSTIPQASSSGGSSDGAFVYGQFGDNVNYVDYTTIVWLNHNKKFGDGLFSYSFNRDGASIPGGTLYEGIDMFGRMNSVATYPKFNAKLLTFGWVHTEPLSQEKMMGELILANQNTIQLTKDFSSYEERWREKVKEIALGDGGIHRVVTLSSTGRNLRYEANCQFRFLTESEVISLNALKESGAPFYFQPESETRPDKIFKCHWTGPWDIKYTSSYKGAGYTVSMNLKEVK